MYSPEKGKSFSLFQTVSSFSPDTRKFSAYNISVVHYYYYSIIIIIIIIILPLVLTNLAVTK